jgi:hypothetical protein
VLSRTVARFTRVTSVEVSGRFPKTVLEDLGFVASCVSNVELTEMSHPLKKSFTGPAAAGLSACRSVAGETREM